MTDDEFMRGLKIVATPIPQRKSRRWYRNRFRSMRRQMQFWRMVALVGWLIVIGLSMMGGNR